MNAESIEHIGQLIPDERNARKHTPKNIGMIENALREVGASRSIVIDEDGKILAGNGTIEAAAQAGIEKVVVVEATGNEIVAVRRTGLTEEQKRKLAIYDNRTAELAEWDEELLRELNTEVDLTGIFPNEMLKGVSDPKDLDASGGLNYKPQFGVIVICESEDEQQQMFERLSAEGLNVRVVVT